jgi:TDG/mug DNA glycosylase family protein
MKTEQINIRLDADLVSALERVSREEALDRATTIRRLLESSIKDWELERALLRYRRGEVSLGRAAEESGLTQWELIDAVRAAGMAYPLDADDVAERLREIDSPQAYGSETLPDIPPKPGGVLLVGINPAPVSVAAGHYYQGRLGRRLWRRLESIGLLRDPSPGAEDEAFAREGHGLTDLVKRATTTSAELDASELAAGVDVLRKKILEWKPGLVLFAFSEPARRLLGRKVRPGEGANFEGVPTFLLSGPYAAGAETERIDAELKSLLGTQGTREPDIDAEQTQRVTANDLRAGQIRLPRPAKRFFPSAKARVDLVLRGTRVEASYDPRLGPDRERSAVLRIGHDQLRKLVGQDDVLRVSRGLGGIVVLE